MNNEASIKLLTIIHEMQIAAAESRAALTILIDEATTDAVILPIEGAMVISLVLDVQSQLLMHLLEENSEIRDKLETFVHKLNLK